MASISEILPQTLRLTALIAQQEFKADLRKFLA
jgi:hypothetical protein